MDSVNPKSGANVIVLAGGLVMAERRKDIDQREPRCGAITRDSRTAKTMSSKHKAPPVVGVSEVDWVDGSPDAANVLVRCRWFEIR